MAAKIDHLKQAADIVVVDDNINNLGLLTQILTAEGYQVRSTDDPILAIESIQAYPPGLILLDVMMPEIDGFEVCQRLKAHEATRDVPIIFISALQEVDDKVRGFEVGGVDFISKPFQKLEVLARVKTHLQLRKLQMNLEQQVVERTKELRESEMKFKDLVEQSPVVFELYDRNGILVQANSAFENLWLLPRNDVLGKFNIFESKQVRELGFLPFFEKAYAGEKAHVPDVEFDASQEEVAQGKSRKRRISSIMYPVLDISGHVTHVALMHEDITDLKQAEQKIQLSEERFQATFEQAAVGIAHVSPDGCFLRINQKFCDIVGYSQKEMLELTFQEITHPDDLKADLQHLEELLAGEVDSYTMEKRYLRKSGQVVWVNLNVSLLHEDTGDPRWFVAVVKDISVRKGIEQALNESELKYRTLVEQASDAIIVIQDEVIRFANARFAQITGYTFVGLQDTHFTNYLPEDQHSSIVAMYQKREEEDTPSIIEVTLQHIDGSRIPVELQAGLTTFAGNPAVQVFIRDITERKKVEREIQAYQERLKALASQLTLTEERERRRIAVELHDHVGQSLAFTRMQVAAAQKTGSDARRDQILSEVSETLRDTIQETRSLVFDLSSPLMNEIGLNAAIADWLKERVEKEAGLETELIEKGPTIQMAEDIRAILFRNVREILTNVIRHAQANKVIVTLEQKETHVCIIIQDDGIGFDPESNIPTVTRSGRFGLFSIQELMSDLGGSVDIDSSPGRGCAITLTVSQKAL